MNDNRTSSKMSVAEVEAELLTIWQESLPISGEEIPMDVSFLALGGDSLSAMACIARIRTIFSLEFDICDFFLDDSTLSDFAKSIAAKQNN